MQCVLCTSAQMQNSVCRSMRTHSVIPIAPTTENDQHWCIVELGVASVLRIFWPTIKLFFCGHMTVDPGTYFINMEINSGWRKNYTKQTFPWVQQSFKMTSLLYSQIILSIHNKLGHNFQNIVFMIWACLACFSSLVKGCRLFSGQ